jgi:actin-like ATPase involved in cell morphogenesis
VYHNRAAELRNEYKTKISEWESNMIAQGKGYLVRKSFRKKLEKNLNIEKRETAKPRKKSSPSKAVKKKLKALQKNIKQLKLEERKNLNRRKKLTNLAKKLGKSTSTKKKNSRERAKATK